ncbi:MAG: hypothetical protein HY020_03975 [Burkholderiales bacterium]|nr:hypothetical protein [Burkholderiales bacterium]
MAGFANTRRCTAAALLCWAAVLPQLADAHPHGAASAPKHGNDAPLRFDPPAAGTPQQSNANYDACIDHPSPDGVAVDCQALLRTPPTAKAKARPRHH